MEGLYLEPICLQKAREWISDKVVLKQYFEQYSEYIKFHDDDNLFMSTPNTNVTQKNEKKKSTPKEKSHPGKEIQALRNISNSSKFTTKNLNLEAKSVSNSKVNQASSSKETVEAIVLNALKSKSFKFSLVTRTKETSFKCIKRRKNENKSNNKAGKIQVTDNCNDSSLLSLKYPEEITDSMQTFQGEMSRFCRKKQKNIGGELSVDTTKRRGKKDLIERENFVISFRVHKPFKHHTIETSARIGRCLQEITVLNYQTLADLREAIFCENDYQVACGDISNDPSSVDFKPLAKDKYKSGMFYIGNTFYVANQRWAEDYSKELREWWLARGIQLGISVPMDSVKVEDLEIRFGYPYVYMHQGSCEHIIIISDARLLTTKDSLHSSDYPNLVKISRSTPVFCGLCSKLPAEWIVSGCEDLVYNHNMLCDQCFNSYLYIDGQKVGNFKAFHWKQRAVLYA